MEVRGPFGDDIDHDYRRTLLHGADCLRLDESFAALDPETLHQALQCVLERAPTLLVIAHP